jgi:hypothetical protein
VTLTSEFPNSYSPSVLAAIEQAFNAVWATLYAHVPPKDKAATQELSIALSQTLVRLVADGITDAEELRRKALENMVLTSSR